MAQCFGDVHGDDEDVLFEVRLRDVEEMRRDVSCACHKNRDGSSDALAV